MNLIKKFFTYLIYHPERILLYIWDSIAPIIPNLLFLAVRYRLIMGYWMDFGNPKTYTEKLQWLKLYDRQPEYTQMVDKVAVKEYAANIIGEEHIIPTIGVWNKPEDIPWSELPNQFVAKVTHDSGGIVICKEKTQLDIPLVIKKLSTALKRDYYYTSREWPYKNVPRRIIIEKYLVDESGCELKDYKFYCFNGIPKLLLVASNRYTTHNYDYFDLSFHHLDITSRSGAQASKSLEIPKNFEMMKEIARKLSQNIPHVRVDLYNKDGKIYFGELTFYDSSGYDNMNSEEWNNKLGEWTILPNLK